MKRRRILFVTAGELMQASGQSIQAYARRLSARGDVVALLYHGALSEQEDGRLSYTVIQAEYQGKLLSRVTKRRLAAFDPQIIHAFGRWTNSLRCAFEAAILSNAALIVHIEDDEVSYHRTRDAVDVARSVWDDSDGKDAKSYSAKTGAEILGRMNWSQYLVSGPGAPVDPVLFQLAMHSARGFTIIWRHMASSVPTFFKSATMVLPPGHESDFSKIKPGDARAWLINRLSLPEDSTLIGHAGSIRHMNQEFALLLRAFAKVLGRAKNAHLVLWGRDWKKQETSGMIRRLRLEQNVHQLGWIASHDEHLGMVAAVDLHVCAGANNRFNRCRLPSRLCQCFAAGKPVVLWRDGFGESLTDGQDALLVGEDEVDLWAQQLLRLVEDRGLRNRLGQRAAELAGDWFNMEARTTELQGFYDRVFEEHTRAWRKDDIEAKDIPAGAVLAEFIRTRWTLLGHRYRRIALYGQGRHTSWMKSILGSRLEVNTSDSQESPVVTCLLDDQPASEGVIKPECADSGEFEAVILSSDTFQGEMRARCRSIFGPEMPVVDLYEGIPAGPYLKPEKRTATLQTEMSYGFELVGPWLNGASLPQAVDRLEILPVELLDRNREIVRSLRRLAKNLSIGIGWHYLLDLSWTVSHMQAGPPCTVLDAGAGNGLLQYYLAWAGFDVVAVDRTRVNPNPVCRRFIEEAPGSLRRITGDLRNLDTIEDESIDIVVSISALEHNKPGDLGRCVQELIRALKPGGVLLATLGAARDEDWYHNPSGGWNYTETTLRKIFDLGGEVSSNYDRYDDLLEDLRNCEELRRGLAGFYYSSGANGMPWGWWDPQYQPVGICKVKKKGSSPKSTPGGGWL